MEHKGTVTLETLRLILRQFVPEDMEPMFQNCWRHFDVWKWTNYAPMDCLEDVVEKAHMFTADWLGAYDRPNRYSWAIQLKSTGQPIGRMFGMRPDDRVEQIELAYELGPDWWGRGLMTEAVREAIRFFLRDVGLNRVHANHAHENPASGRVMQKCGMTYEGTLRQACRCNNGLFDMVCYAILAEDDCAPR